MGIDWEDILGVEDSEDGDALMHAWEDAAVDALYDDDRQRRMFRHMEEEKELDDGD